MRTKLRPLPLGTLLAVKGVSFRQDDVKKVVEQDEVRIRHVRDNPYDPYACTIETLDGTVLGFVERTQNRRLAKVHPGGVWRAVVEAVYRRELWGLRVRLLELLYQEDADFGALQSGARHRGDGVFETSEGQVSALRTEDGAESSDAEEDVDVEPVLVTAISGRTLGILVQDDGGVVVVEDDDGVRARYPKSVVVFNQPADLPH